jgi:hypothetical protein
VNGESFTRNHLLTADMEERWREAAWMPHEKLNRATGRSRESAWFSRDVGSDGASGMVSVRPADGVDRTHKGRFAGLWRIRDHNLVGEIWALSPKKTEAQGV